MRWAEDLSGRSFAFAGSVETWPRYFGRGPIELLQARGARVTDAADAALDYLVVGEGRAKGRAEAKRRAEARVAKGEALVVLDERAFVHLCRPDLRGVRFFFTGGFELLGSGIAAAGPPALVATSGAETTERLEEADVLVVGERRSAGKTAALREAEGLAARGLPLTVLDEAAFLELVGIQVRPGGATDLASFVASAQAKLDPGRLKRALDMLKAESFRLYVDARDDAVVGIVRSQTSAEKVYSCRLAQSGDYGCVTDDLQACMGMGWGARGAPCKHLLVLVLGLVQSHGVDPARLETWLAATRKRAPAQDMQPLADTLVRYRAAEAGEIDWRPTETVPEDFYAF